MPYGVAHLEKVSHCFKVNLFISPKSLLLITRRGRGK
jgi:hypothetical protein